MPITRACGLPTSDCGFWLFWVKVKGKGVWPHICKTFVGVPCLLQTAIQNAGLPIHTLPVLHVLSVFRVIWLPVFLHQNPSALCSGKLLCLYAFLASVIETEGEETTLSAGQSSCADTV